MIDSESQYPISYLCSITTFCLSLAVKKLFDTAVLARISLYRGKVLGFWGPGTPKIWIVVILTPKGTSLGQAALVEPLSANIGLQVFSNGVNEKKITIKNPEISHATRVFHVPVGAPLFVRSKSNLADLLSSPT